LIHTLLAELVDSQWEISTPFLAYLGELPVQVFYVNERTACIQIIGQDQRKIVRLDLLFIKDPTKLRRRAADEVKLMMKEARDRGRENGRLNRPDSYLAS
jgi:hypothetical protein